MRENSYWFYAGLHRRFAFILPALRVKYEGDHIYLLGLHWVAVFDKNYRAGSIREAGNLRLLEILPAHFAI